MHGQATLEVQVLEEEALGERQLYNTSKLAENWMRLSFYSFAKTEHPQAGLAVSEEQKPTHYHLCSAHLLCCILYT